jgi:hypothetical protein
MPPPPAKSSTPDYDKMLTQKVAAGLPLAQAKEVIARQKKRDAKVAALAAAKAALESADA